MTALIQHRIVVRTLSIAWGVCLLAGYSSRPNARTTPEPSVRATRVAAENAPIPSLAQTISRASAQPVAPFEGEGWKPIFDGRSLSGWRATAFEGRGPVQCTKGMVVLNKGDPFTGIDWTNTPPGGNYEVALDAMRVEGSDFFCGLTFPVRDSFCSLIVGGWGGNVVGLSSLDGYDASENDSSRGFDFENGRWYRIRLRVTEGKIEVWIGPDKIINVVTTDRRISLRPGDIELSKPFGICAWQTTAAMRAIRLRPVPPAAVPGK